MKTLKAIIIICLILSSCSHYYYTPDVRNAPLFKQKGDFTASANTSSSTNFSPFNNNSDYSDTKYGIALNAAYAINEKYGVLVNYRSLYSSDNGTYGVSDGKGYLLEAAVGTYKVYNDDFCFEGFVGLGIGNQAHNYEAKRLPSIISYDNNDSTTIFPKSEIGMQTFFIQSDFGYKAKLFEIALSARLANINFGNVESDLNKYIAYKDNNGEFVYKEDKKDLDNLIRNSSVLLFEPTLIVRLSLIEVLKLQLQYTYLVQLTNTTVPTRNDNFSLGIQLLLPARKTD